MTTTVADPQPASAPVSSSQAVVAVYNNHPDAEDAVRLLHKGGIPVEKISIVGRNFELREDVQGFYRPSDFVKEGAASGAWFGGLFGLLLGIGFFVIPVAGAIWVLGPLSGLIAGAIGGGAVGALVNGLVGLGVPKDQALKYQDRLQAGEFLVVVHGTSDDVRQAQGILPATAQTHTQAFSAGG